VIIDVHEATEVINSAAGLGFRERLGAAGAAELDRRASNNPPAVGIDFDRAPGSIAQVEIQAAV